MSTPVSKPAVWFWIVSIISLLWNLVGVMAFYMQVSTTPEAIQAMSEGERSLYTDLPGWTVIAFAIAVFGDTLGSVLLLLRKRLATPVFTVSFFFTLVQMIYTLFISNMIAIRGASGAVLPVLILVVGVFLIWFSLKSSRKGWLL